MRELTPQEKAALTRARKKYREVTREESKRHCEKYCLRFGNTRYYFVGRDQELLAG